MEINPNPIINPANWANTLLEAVESRHGDQVHKYIVRDGNGRLSVTENLRSDQRKLTIREIVDETRANLAQNADNLKRSTLEDPDLFWVAESIKACTKELIDDRAAKREHSRLRKTAKFFSAVGCLILVGIPFYRNLVKGDRVFRDQTAQLKREVDQALLPSTAAPSAANRPVAALNPAEILAARGARVQQLQTDLRQELSNLTRAGARLEDMQTTLAKETDAGMKVLLQNSISFQQELINHSERMVENIRRELGEIGGEIRTAQPPTTEAAPSRESSRLSQLEKERDRLAGIIATYERTMHNVQEYRKRTIQNEVDVMKVTLERINASIAELKQRG